MNHFLFSKAILNFSDFICKIYDQSIRLITVQIIREIGFWSRGGRPEFFLGGLPSGIGRLLSITSIGRVLLHTRGVASSKF